MYLTQPQQIPTEILDSCYKGKQKRSAERKAMLKNSNIAFCIISLNITRGGFFHLFSHQNSHFFEMY